MNKSPKSDASLDFVAFQKDGNGATKNWFLLKINVSYLQFKDGTKN